MDYNLLAMDLAMYPPRVMKADLPDPAATYAMQTLMDWAPNADSASWQTWFGVTTVAGRTLNSFVPSWLDVRGGVPRWNGDLPFPTTTPQGRRTNSALVTLRRDVSAFLESYGASSLVRPMRTNWQSPTRLPALISL
jgi:hypothetical protein